MKIVRCLVVILFGVAASSLAVDELALRLQPALEAITPDGLLAHSRILRFSHPMNSKVVHREQKAKNFRSSTSVINSNRSV